MIAMMLFAGCLDDSRWDETDATALLDEAMASSKGEMLARRFTSITTDTTMGERAEEAARDRAAWFASQIPCSTITIEESTLTVDFGTLEDGCVYDGHTYAGVLALSWRDRGLDDLDVVHEWRGLSDGTVTLDGRTAVYWTSPSVPARFVNDLVWSDDDRAVEETSDVWVERLTRESGEEGRLGLELDGWRLWEGEYGLISLDIDDIQIRGIDPAPQAGTWRFRNDDGDVVRMQFDRVDADTIRVTITGDGWTHIVYLSTDDEGRIEAPEGWQGDGRIERPDANVGSGRE